MKTIFLMLVVFSLISFTIPEISSMCAADKMEWWEPCNDTGPFSDGIYVKYSVLVPILAVIILVVGIPSLIYWRKRK